MTSFLALVVYAVSAQAESIEQAFRSLRDSKTNRGRMPSDVKGTVCQRMGAKPRNHKGTLCYNKHGPRCDRGFLKERECYYQEPCRNCYEDPDDDENFVCDPFVLRSNEELIKEQCPYPCGCIFSSSPRKKTRSVHAIKSIRVGADCSGNFNKVEAQLKKWGVPKEQYINFEMAILGDSSHFVTFHLFSQPDKNKAEYGLSVGAARCHRSRVEIGFMDTGKWQVETNAQTRCTSVGGGSGKSACTNVGISNEQVEIARKTLEWYAWNKLEVNGRRLRSVNSYEQDFLDESLAKNEDVEQDDEDDFGEDDDEDLGEDDWGDMEDDMVPLPW